MKCNKCKDEFEDGDLVTVYNLHVDIGERQRIPLNRDFIKIYHYIPDYIKQQLIGDVPEDCGVSVGKEKSDMAIEGIFYQNGIYSIRSIFSKGYDLSGISLQINDKGTRVEGNLEKCLNETKTKPFLKID